MNIRVLLDVAAGGTFYPLTGSQFEFLEWPAYLEIAIVSRDATGTSALQATVYSGSDLLQAMSPVDVKATAFVAYPEDFSLTDYAAAGERIGIQLDCVASANAVCLVVVKITPL